MSQASVSRSTFQLLSFFGKIYFPCHRQFCEGRRIDIGRLCKACFVPFYKMNNGLMIPSLGFGTAQPDADTTPALVEQNIKDAIDIGYRHFDSAFMYGTEVPLGNAVREKIAENAIKREDLFITSKIWCNSMRHDLVIPSLLKSLKNLGLDYLDLYYIHWPFALKENDIISFYPDADGKIPPFSDVDYMDTWAMMEECVEYGLTKSIGVCNFNHEQLERLLYYCRIVPVANQVECHPYLAQNKMYRFCQLNEIQLIGFSPLGAYGTTAIPGKNPNIEMLHDRRLKKIAKGCGKSTSQVALRWQIQRGMVTITRSSDRGRMEKNFDIFDFVLYSDDLDKIFAMNCDGRLHTLDWFKSHPNYPFNIEY